jgi:hypothetical protein
MISSRIRIEAPPAFEDATLLEDAAGPSFEPGASLPPLVSCADADRRRAAAIGIWEALDDGAGLADIACAAGDLSAFSIGHLLHGAGRKDLLHWPGSREDLFDRIDDALRRSGDGRLRNRMQAIRAMREMGLVPEAVPDKMLKPAGTTPCIRGLGFLMEEWSKIPFETIISASRGRAVVTARFEVIWILRTVCGHSLTVIGKHVGGRDHTTVLNSLNKVSLEMKRNAGYRNSVNRLCEKADMIGVIQSHRILTRQAGFLKN